MRVYHLHPDDIPKLDVHLFERLVAELPRG